MKYLTTEDTFWWISSLELWNDVVSILYWGLDTETCTGISLSWSVGWEVHGHEVWEDSKDDIRFGSKVLFLSTEYFWNKPILVLLL